jgi:hypothetical protein
MEPEIFRSISKYLKREKLLEGTTRLGLDEKLGIFSMRIDHLI